MVYNHSVFFQCTPIVILIIVLFLVPFLLKLYGKWTLGHCYSKVCLVGKTAIITGANQGIGYETALDFAQRGARVILACRNEEKANTACLKIIEETGNKNVLVRIVDFSSFVSVQKFAKNILETERRLDLLINNAGVLNMDDSQKTIDGHSLLVQVNYYSPFLLTNLLLDLMKKSQNGRVVNVSSIQAIFKEPSSKSDLIQKIKEGHIVSAMFALVIGTLNLLSKKLSTYPWLFNDYGYTKWCIILFTQELASRLVDSDVTTYCLHPGLVVTEIFKTVPGLLNMFICFLKITYFKSPREGAQTTIHCALEKGIEKYSGDYFADCRRVPTFWNARNPQLATELWEKTKKIVKLD